MPKNPTIYVPSDSINVMGLYYDLSRATPRILDAMRKSIFTGENANIPYSDIKTSQDEIAGMRRDIDRVTHSFSQ